VAVNGTAQTLTPTQKRQLAGPAVSTPFDAYQLLFPTFDNGRVFDLSNRDVRAIKDMLKQDGQARKVEQVLTLPIRSAAWEIRPAPGGDKEYRYIRAQLDDKLDKVIDQLTTAISFRKAFFELTFDLDGDTVILADIAYRPPATCEAAWDPKTGVPLGFRQRIGNPGGIITVTTRQQVGDTPGYVTVEPDRAFVFVHGSYREPIEGLSDLDVALWCYETVKKIQFLWFSFLEQQSLPKLVAYGDDQTQADRNADALADAKASGVLGVPRSADPTARAFDIVESSGKGAAQFLDAITYLEGKMSASILAGFTDLAGISAHSRTGSGGSYALSADQSEFFLAARQAVADEIAEAVSRDLIGKLCVLQFGADCKPPTLEIGPLSKRDKDRAMGMLNSLLTADHFNAPPGLIDLLIKSTSGYLGLPVDQVAKLVDNHPAKDPTATPPGQPPTGDTAGYVPDQPHPATPVGQGNDGDPAAAKFKELAGLAHTVNVAHELVTRAQAGEPPADVVAEVGQRYTARPRRRRRRKG